MHIFGTDVVLEDCLELIGGEVESWRVCHICFVVSLFSQLKVQCCFRIRGGCFVLNSGRDSSSESFGCALLRFPLDSFANKYLGEVGVRCLVSSESLCRALIH